MISPHRQHPRLDRVDRAPRPSTPSGRNRDRRFEHPPPGNIDLLARQAAEFEVLVAAAGSSVQDLRPALASYAAGAARAYAPEVVVGRTPPRPWLPSVPTSSLRITGVIGLRSTLAAAGVRRDLALANKSPSSSVATRSAAARPIRSCPSTPSTRRSRSRCAAGVRGGAATASPPVRDPAVPRAPRATEADVRAGSSRTRTGRDGQGHHH